MPAGRRDRSGPSRYPRTARVNQVLREVVAEELERLADVDERLRLLTVTAVDTAPDLRRATVYLSSLPEEAVDALADRRVHLQRTLAGQMRLKRTPQLVFVADPAVRSGEQVDQILRRIQPATPLGVPIPEKTAAAGDESAGVGEGRAAPGAGIREVPVPGAGTGAGTGAASGATPGATGEAAARGGGGEGLGSAVDGDGAHRVEGPLDA